MTGNCAVIQQCYAVKPVHSLTLESPVQTSPSTWRRWLLDTLYAPLASAGHCAGLDARQLHAGAVAPLVPKFALNVILHAT